jgi:tetratricopeptide (TPR) repeat protein
MALQDENKKLYTAIQCNKIKDPLENAIELYRKRKFSSALMELNSIIDGVDSRNMDCIAMAYYFRGNAYMQLNDFEQAVDDFNKVVSVNPEHAQAYFDRGRAFRQLNKIDSAEKDFKYFISLEPDHFKGYWMLGKLHKARGNYQKAIFFLNKAIEKNPQKPQLYKEQDEIRKEINQI